MSHRQIQLPDRMLTCVLLLLLVLLPATTLAQTHSLRVTVRDVAGQGIPDITITVHTKDGQELAQARTDAQGTAAFAELGDVVRVLVRGQPRGGPTLYQLGDDARGVRFDLSQAKETATLDFRVDHDGLVLPDPATMISLEGDGPEADPGFVLPTAALATPAPLPVADRADATGIVSVAPPRETTRQDSWVPLVTLLIVIVAGGVILAFSRPRNAP